jgi:hypothetical protein
MARTVWRLVQRNRPDRELSVSILGLCQLLPNVLGLHFRFLQRRDREVG